MKEHTGDSDKFLIVILGPTAVGKTSTSMELAKHFNTEILSADSRQFYQEMKIGTAAPSEEELQQVKHHFVHHLPLDAYYNVSQFEQDSLEVLGHIFRKRNTVIMTGGSGLYIDAVCHGIDDLPDPDPKLREQINREFQEKGIEHLQEKLKYLDPEYYKQVDLNNPKRLMRAIEVSMQTGIPYSHLRINHKAERDFNIIKIGLYLDRDQLNERIHKRVDQMIEQGLVEEVRSLWPFRNYNALNTVGYKEIFRYLEGQISLEQAITDIKTNTRRYAKRQMTWFKRDESIHWFTPMQKDELVDFLEKKVGRN
ncbi:MAG: tRNA (adenosine(37)-N6)-dimethylallyltransferase MiaA [Bacteroidales bacterium]|nr:tRNA (adenosine(37)-N6)-dimethylallyltransferase MiaA [Bacteroidales bacterium]